MCNMGLLQIARGSLSAVRWVTMHAALTNCRRVMTLLASWSEFVAFAMKPEHFGGCSQSVHAGVAPDCSGATFCCSLGYDACCSGEIEQ